MDFIESAKVLVPAMSGLNLSVFQSSNADALAQFEKRYVFSPELQPQFTSEGLRHFFEKSGPEHIYLCRDALEITSVLIQVEDRWLLFGPYCAKTWNRSAARTLLASNGLNESALVPFQSYRCAIPVQDDEFVVRTAALVLTSTVGNPPREVEVIDMAAQRAEDLRPHVSDEYSDFTQINRRYAWEFEIMECVRQGQTARTLEVWRGGPELMTGLRFMSDSISDQIAGACTLRTLVRHAALQAGLTPIFVDALSQEYAQQMHRAVDGKQLTELIQEYIAAFCRAVRDNAKLNCSAHVRRSIQYIEIHLSEPITVETLCELNGITRQRLGSLFHKEVGMTVKQYIMKRRCETAAELLRDSRLQVQEIAHYVGYEDSVYFNRVFKSVMGESPLEYRKKTTIF